MFPAATKDEQDESKDRVEPELHLCQGVAVAVVHLQLTVWGISIGFSSAVGCLCWDYGIQYGAEAMVEGG